MEEHMAELPLECVGARLRLAREAAGKSRADLATITKISERLLAALEEGNYAALPARAYATGFARSYARAVGLDAEAIVQQVRGELDGAPAFGDRPASTSFEPGDPARVPSRRLAWIAASLALLLVAGLAVWRMMSGQSNDLPSILPADAPKVVASPRPIATPAQVANGPVVVTARSADVWLRITDGYRVLLQKNMAQGESFTIPADAADPRLRTGRPDALAVTIGGQPLPSLADRQVLVSDVSLTAAALRARAVPQADASPASPPTTTASATPGPEANRSAARPSFPHARSTRVPEAGSIPAPTPSSPAATPSANPSTVPQ